MTTEQEQPSPRRRGRRELVVASHRRSGTHVMLEYISREFGIEAGKSHGFVDSRNPPRVPVVYMVRDPIEVLWSTYRWFVHGQSSNRAIADALRGLSFAEYLRGDGGPLTGYAGWERHRGDALQHDRGMLYQPIRFWADHVRSYFDAGEHITVVRYEHLVEHPGAQIARVAEAIGAPMPEEFTPIRRNELVGHAPSAAALQPTIEYWDHDSLALLRREAGQVLDLLGYARQAPVVAHSAPTRQVVRYVSRDDHSGYAVAGRRCMDAMEAAGIDFVWEPQPKQVKDGRAAPRPHTAEYAMARYQPDAVCDITVLHTMPERWPGLRRLLGKGTFIGHTVWELERLPGNWMGDVHVADRLWVPTEWNRNTFLEGDIRRPVHVVPHVATNGHVADPPIDIPDDVKIFSTVAVWHPRKRPDWTVEAFARVFTKDDPVLLIVKTPPWTDGWPTQNELERMTWWQLMQVLRRHPNPPNVMLVNDDFTDAQINGLLTWSDCYVSLSASEGWGLGVFDAATLGTPVITTGFGGQVSYLGDDHPGLVPFGWTEVGDSENSPHLEPDMVWAAPDLDAAAAMMRSVLDPTSAIVAGAPALSTRLKGKYSRMAVGIHIASILDSIR